MRPQFAASVQMLKRLGETPVTHRNRFANCVNDRLACRRSTGVHSSELEPRTAAAAAAAAIAGTAEIVGDRYDYLLKYLFHHYFESIMLPTIIIDCHERADVDSGTGWNRYRKRHSIAQPFSPDGWNASQWDAIADVVASCDAAAEAALQRADCGFVGREAALLFASAWARHALQYVQSGNEEAGREKVKIDIDERDPLCAVEAIVRQLCNTSALRESA